jgi:hypothetical protein
MSRTLRILFTAAVSLCIAGASAYACDDHKAEKASASTESHAGCSAMAKATCAEKGMSAENCVYCCFVNDLKANAEKVQFTVVDGKDGVQFVFAAVTKDDVVTAQALASKGYALMSTPAHCDMAKAKMAGSDCGGCKQGAEAFSGSEILFKNTKDGAVATVKTKDKAKVEKIHAFASALLPAKEMSPQS